MELHKMLKLVNHFVVSLKKSGALTGGLIIRNIHEEHFNSEDEIMENAFEKFTLIGMNLPDSKNILTETALEKLCISIKNFESSNECFVAILHGCGGNFCCGMVSSKEAFRLSQNLINALHTSKKPIIAALDGYTTDFGLHLAVMCDMRIMDKSAIAGLSDSTQKSEIHPLIYHRLILNVGLAHTFEMMCSRQLWSAIECLKFGLVSKVVERGCALGQSMMLAQNITFNSSLEKVIEHKSKILSFLFAKT